MTKFFPFASGIAFAVLAVHAQDVRQGPQTPMAPAKPAMVLVPDKSSDAVLDEIDRRRRAAFLNKMRYEAGYGPCVNKSKSKEEALTCLARWEAAASEYHREDIAFASEIEQRDLEAIDVINQQLADLTGRRAHMRQGSLERLKAEIDRASEAIRSESRSATLLARAQFQSDESLRLARRAEIDRRWPVPALVKT